MDGARSVKVCCDFNGKDLCIERSEKIKMPRAN